MKLKIEDYLHFYIGQYVMIGGCNPPETEPIKLIGVDPKYIRCIVYCEREHIDINYEISSAKPILRSLSDMTGMERAELAKHQRKYTSDNILPNIQVTHHLQLHHSNRDTQITIWLIKKGFDVFGLIEAGLAIKKD